MISFTILTSTPAALRDRLIARDVIKEQVFPLPGGGTETKLVGVREGLEWHEVANPIITNVGPPATFDTRRCYLVKLVLNAEDNETEGEPKDGRPLTERTKLGKWIRDNSVPETITSADGRSWPSLKVGNNFWLVNSDDFGVWQ